MSEKQAIRIEIEYDNGEIWRAEGADAAKILAYWLGGEVMAHIHGANYAGPYMVKVKDDSR